MKRFLEIIVALVCTIIGFIGGIFVGMKYLQVLIVKELDKDKSNNIYTPIIVASRLDAEKALEKLQEIIDKYGCVRVMDLYDLFDMKACYPDYKYGWYDLKTANVVRVRTGYKLDLPQPKILK